MSVIQSFALQRKIITRERAAGSYHVSSAFFARYLAQLPLTLMATLFLIVPLYWIANLNPGAVQFFRFLALLTLHALSAMSLGMFISSVSPSIEIGQVLGPLIAVIFILFGGSFASVSTIPVVIRWMQWLSLIRYTYGGLIINE